MDLKFSMTDGWPYTKREVWAQTHRTELQVTTEVKIWSDAS